MWEVGSSWVGDFACRVYFKRYNAVGRSELRWEGQGEQISVETRPVVQFWRQIDNYPGDDARNYQGVYCPWVLV